MLTPAPTPRPSMAAEEEFEAALDARRRTLRRMVIGFALAAAAVVLLLATQAHAQVVLGAPAAPDAGFLDVPVELAAGQPAPFDGFELSEVRARQLVLNQQQAAPASSVTTKAAVVIAVSAFVLGVVATAVVWHEVK